MIINWHGQSFFEMRVKTNGEPFNVLINPEKEIESKLILTTKTVKAKNTFIISEPGEYEVSGVFVKGIPFGDSVIYKFEVEGMKLCFLDLMNLTTDEIDKIGEVDIIIMPSAPSKEASSVISQIEPRVVIPFYDSKEDIDNFLHKMGKEDIEPQDKLKITVKDLPKEDTKIELLK